MSSAQPKITGIFAKSPLLHVLTSLLEHTSTGTLVVETPDAVRSALVLERGVPTKMRLGQATVRFGEMLVELGWLRHDAATKTYEQASANGQLHGQVLVAEKILDEELLGQALRRQLVKKLQWAAALPPETVFGFYEGVDYLSKWRGGATPVGPLVAIWILARSRADPQLVATMMNRIAGRAIKIHSNAQLRAFGFDRAELTLLDVLRAKPQTSEALTRLGLVSPHALERMIYALTLARHLDFGLGHNPMGIGAVSEREESLLQPKESLRPSRPVVLTAGMTAADPLQLGLDEEGAIDIERPKLGSVHAPVVTPLDAIGVGSAAVAKRHAPESVSELAPARGPARSGTNEASAERATNSSAVVVNERGAPEVGQLSPAIVERRAQIEKLDATLADLDYFEVLGVTRDASAASVQDAYLKAAKTH
ncbi:MAG TPA: J domain-containing protein, partial [Polyangiaceae bacterium]|nr:J domain-containing protein [Polyangiaceae bacterium]